MTPRTIAFAAGTIGQAVRILATRPGLIGPRLEEAGQKIRPVLEDDLPEDADLRARYRRIRNCLIPASSGLEAGARRRAVHQMTDREASVIAEALCDLGADVDEVARDW